MKNINYIILGVVILLILFYNKTKENFSDPLIRSKADCDRPSELSGGGGSGYAYCAANDTSAIADKPAATSGYYCNSCPAGPGAKCPGNPGLNWYACPARDTSELSGYLPSHTKVENGKIVSNGGSSYIYKSEADAKAACVAGGWKGLCTQNNTPARCAAGWFDGATSTDVGYHMTKLTPGYGDVGCGGGMGEAWVPYYPGAAGAYCCGMQDSTKALAGAVKTGDGFCTSNYGKFASKGIFDCQQQCAIDSKCKGFSYQNDKTQNCYKSTTTCSSPTKNEFPWVSFTIGDADGGGGACDIDKGLAYLSVGDTGSDGGCTVGYNDNTSWWNANGNAYLAKIRAATLANPQGMAFGQQSNGCWHILKWDPLSTGANKKTKSMYPRYFEVVRPPTIAECGGGAPPKPPPPVPVDPSFVEFEYTGAIQHWKCPPSISKVEIVLVGAKGGGFVSGAAASCMTSPQPPYTCDVGGGAGGYGKIQMDVTPGQTYEIFVGGKGRTMMTSAGNIGNGNRGGWPNGGSGSGPPGSPGTSSGGWEGTGSGGGSTSISGQGAGLTDPIAVVGGGGGSYGLSPQFSAASWNTAAAGGIGGGINLPGGTGVSPRGGSSSGGKMLGADGTPAACCDDDGGGGGGYLGGTAATGGNGSGGGGSGFYVGGSVKLIETKSGGGQSIYPAGLGHGYLSIRTIGCTKGYVLSSGACSAPQVANCKTQLGGSLTCSACNTGYTLKNNTCTLTPISGCKLKIY